MPEHAQEDHHLVVADVCVITITKEQLKTSPISSRRLQAISLLGPAALLAPLTDVVDLGCLRRLGLLDLFFRIALFLDFSDLVLILLLQRTTDTDS